MPLVNQTLLLSKAAVSPARLLNFPLAHPAFPQSCLLLEKKSAMKAATNLQRKGVTKPGAGAGNKCQPSSFLHLPPFKGPVPKPLFFRMVLRWTTRTQPPQEEHPGFPKVRITA